MKLISLPNRLWHVYVCTYIRIHSLWGLSGVHFEIDYGTYVTYGISDISQIDYGTYGLWGAVLAGGETVVSKSTFRWEFYRL